MSDIGCERSVLQVGGNMFISYNKYRYSSARVFIFNAEKYTQDYIHATRTAVGLSEGVSTFVDFNSTGMILRNLQVYRI